MQRRFGFFKSPYSRLTPTKLLKIISVNQWQCFQHQETLDARSLSMVLNFNTVSGQMVTKCKDQILPRCRSIKTNVTNIPPSSCCNEQGVQFCQKSA